MCWKFITSASLFFKSLPDKLVDHGFRVRSYDGADGLAVPVQYQSGEYLNPLRFSQPWFLINICLVSVRDK